MEKIKSHAPLTSKLTSSLTPLPAQEPLVLSYYQIDDFLTCPLKYKYIHLLKIPVLPQHAILYGNALHTAVNEFYRRKMSNLPIPAEAIIEIFLKAWVNEGYISREHEELRQLTGIKALRLLIKNEAEQPSTPKFIEKSFQYFLGSNKIIGRMDRVDLTPDGSAIIIDFKSSEVFDQKEADQKAKESLQLKIYASAWLRNEGKLPRALQLFFLESGLWGTYIPELKNIEDTEQKIAQVAEGIRQQIFDATPNSWTCSYCPYRTICPSSGE